MHALIGAVGDEPVEHFLQLGWVHAVGHGAVVLELDVGVHRGQKGSGLGTARGGHMVGNDTDLDPALGRLDEFIDHEPAHLVIAEDKGLHINAILRIPDEV